MSTSNNRIGDACWYRDFDARTRSWSKWAGGWLRAWSTDHIEGEVGFGLFPVGVVEDEQSRRCVSVPVAQICFATVPPTE